MMSSIAASLFGNTIIIVGRFIWYHHVGVSTHETVKKKNTTYIWSELFGSSSVLSRIYYYAIILHKNSLILIFFFQFSVTVLLGLDNKNT